MKILKMAAVGAVAAAIMSANAFAASTILLDVPGVKGGATTKGYEGQIELLSMSYGFDASSGKKTCDVQNLYFVKEVDEASAEIIMSAAIGKVFPTATVTFIKPSAGGTIPVLQYVFSNARFANFSVGGSSAAGFFNESVGLKFTNVQGTVFIPDDKGGTTKKTFKVDCF